MKNDKGLTLVESIIAIVIAAIMLVGFLQACSSAAMILKNVRYRVRAINIAQAEIEDVKTIGNEGIDVLNYTPYLSTNVIIDEGLTAGVGDDVVGEMRTYIREVISAPLEGKKIAVEVRWVFMGNNKTELLETVLYSRL